jgi:hypothetical protein
MSRKDELLKLAQQDRPSPAPNPANPSRYLLATAKLLMVCTPNGI